MVKEIPRSFPVSFRECFHAGSIVQLIKESNKEVDVTAGVDKVSTGALVIRSPDLDLHCLRKDLLR